MPVTPAIALPVESAALSSRREPDAGSSSLLELTSGLARGNDTAWATFHREYGPGLFRYLLGGTRGNYDLAAEALQQVYLRVARYARPCDSTPQFESWLRRLAGSALNDGRRRRNTFWHRLRHHLRSDDQSPAPEQTDRTGDERVFVALDTALAQLDPADRDLLEEKYFSGVDVRSLAAKLNLSPKAAESRLTRARAELRRYLSTLLSDHE